MGGGVGVSGVSEADVTGGERPVLTQRQLLVAFSGLILSVVLSAMDTTIVATALPTITSDLGGLGHVTWVVTVYLLAQTVATPIYGKLGDLFGRKRLFQIAIAVFLLGSALCGLSQNMAELIAFRGLQGLGAGGILVLAQAIVGDLISPRERGRFQSYFAATYGVASVAGPLIGGFLTDSLSWHWVFYVNLPIGIVALVVVAFALPASPRRSNVRIDYVGAVLITLATTSLVLLTTWGGREYEWGSPIIVALGVATVVFGAAFIFVQLRVPEPIMPLRLYRVRAVSIACSLAGVTNIAMFAVAAFIPLFLQVVTGASATSSAGLLLPNVLGVVVGSICAGQLVARTGRYRIFPIIGTASMAGGLLVLGMLTPDTSRFQVGVAMAMVGVGAGVTLPIMMIAAQNAVPFKDLGVTTSAVNFSRTISSTVGLAIFGAIFNAGLSTVYAGASIPIGEGEALTFEAVRGLDPEAQARTLTAFTDAITTVFLVAVPIALVGFALALWLREDPLRRGDERTPGAASRSTPDRAPVEGDGSTVDLRSVDLLEGSARGAGAGQAAVGAGEAER
jgi:EmrB/QacA subfamily drug resistance transporter